MTETTALSTAVLIDLNSIFHSCKRVYGRRPRYGYIVDSLKLFNPVLYAFGIETGTERHFRKYLQSLGCTTIFRRPKIHADGSKSASVDVNITIEAMRLLPNVTGLILISNDHNLAPVITEYRNAGKYVFTIGVEIAKELRERSTKYAEITADATDTPADSMELLPDVPRDALEC